MIRLLAVNFGDNDFHTTFRVAMTTYIQRYHWYSYDPENEDPTKEEICRDLNLLLYPLYLVFQDQFERDWHDDPEGAKKMEAHMRAYLTIEPKDVFINKEVSDKLEEFGPNVNHSFFMVQQMIPYTAGTFEFFAV